MLCSRSPVVKKVQELDEIDLSRSSLLVTVGTNTKTIDNVNIEAWYENIKIERGFVRFKLDSGAQVNILPNRDFKRVNKQFDVR